MSAEERYRKDRQRNTIVVVVNPLEIPGVVEVCIGFRKAMQ